MYRLRMEDFTRITQAIALVFVIIYTITGIIIISITRDITILSYTTNITILLTTAAYLNGLKNKFLNSVASITFLQFFFVDFGIHLILAICQLMIIVSKAKISKEGILFGFVFWLSYMLIVDDIYRVANWMLIPIGDRLIFTMTVFYLLVLSTIITAAIKYREHCLVIRDVEYKKEIIRDLISELSIKQKDFLNDILGNKEYNRAIKGKLKGLKSKDIDYMLSTIRMIKNEVK